MPARLDARGAAHPGGPNLEKEPKLISKPKPKFGVQCSVPEAMRLCRHDWMREALRILVARRGWQLPPNVALGSAMPLLSNGNGSAALGGPAEAGAGPAPHAKRVFAQS